MTGKRKLLLNWFLGLLLVLAAFYSAVAWLWRAAENSAAAALKDQVVSSLSVDLAEGNVFKLGVTLSRMQEDGHVRFAEIRQVTEKNTELMYRTSGSDEGLAGAFDGFSCGAGDRLLRLGGGVGVVTALPGVLAGAECTAAFISSDLPADLKTLKNRIAVSFGALISALMLVVLLLTLSWHKKALALEVAAKTVLAEKEAAIGRMAAQVAHDIRSPLSALGSAAAGLTLPGAQRELIQGAVNRIQDIADDLLQRHRASPAEPARASAFGLSGLIEQVLAEKRVQHKDRPGVRLEFIGGSGIKAAVEPKEFQRLMSNLLNNSVEAFDGPGAVSVGLSESNGKVQIEIRDNGKGITPEILAKLGRKGETHGKKNGNGLGLYHARLMVEGWSGSFSIVSEPGKGTVVVLELPSLTAAPAGQKRMAVLLDDDMLVHMNWKLAAKGAGVALQAYKEPEAFKAGVGSALKDTPIYIDSDLGNGVKGEDIAAELRAAGFSDINLATGHDPEKFAHLPWLKVTGKEPPWA